MLPFNKFIAVAVGIGMLSCGQGKKKDPNKLYFEKASEYNGYIATQFEEVNRLWNATLTKMDDSSLVYQQLDSLINASNTSWHNMDQLADFKGDTIYKTRAAEYFKYMLVTAQTSFKEAIDIGLMPDIPDSLYFKFTAIGNQIGADKDTLINKLKAAQLHFIALTKE